MYPSGCFDSRLVGRSLALSAWTHRRSLNRSASIHPRPERSISRYSTPRLFSCAHDDVPVWWAGPRRWWAGARPPGRRAWPPTPIPGRQQPSEKPRRGPVNVSVDIKRCQSVGFRGCGMRRGCGGRWQPSPSHHHNGWCGRLLEPLEGVQSLIRSPNPALSAARRASGLAFRSTFGSNLVCGGRLGPSLGRGLAGAVARARRLDRWGNPHEWSKPATIWTAAAAK